MRVGSGQSGSEEALGQGLMHLHPDRPGRRVKLWGFNYKNRNTKAGFHAAPHTQQNGGGEVAKDTNDITRQALAVEARNLNMSGSGGAIEIERERRRERIRTETGA